MKKIFFDVPLRWSGDVMVELLGGGWNFSFKLFQIKSFSMFNRCNIDIILEKIIHSSEVDRDIVGNSETSERAASGTM